MMVIKKEATLLHNIMPLSLAKSLIFSVQDNQGTFKTAGGQWKSYKEIWHHVTTSWSWSSKGKGSSLSWKPKPWGVLMMGIPRAWGYF